MTKALKPSYLLRDIPPGLWAKVHEKAAETKGLKIRTVILENLAAWAGYVPSEPQTHDPEAERPESPSGGNGVPTAEEIVILF